MSNLAPGSIGYNLAGLGEFLRGLAKLNDPDKGKRDELTRQLSLHPELADYYKQNPDVLEQAVGSKSFFGSNKKQELLDKIKNSPDSPDLQTTRAKAAAISAVTNKQNADPNANALGNDSIGLQGPQSSPQNVPNPTNDQQDIYNRSLGLPTVAEQNIQRTRALTDKAQLDLANSQLTDINTRRSQATAARDYLKNNNLDPYSAYKNIKSLPSDVALGLTSDPDLTKQVELGQRDNEFQQTLKLQKVAMSSKYDTERLLNVSRINAAQQIAQKTGVDPAIVVQLMQHPAQQAQYGDDNFQPKTPQEQQLKAASQELRTMGGTLSQGQKRQIESLYYRQVNPIIDQINTGKIQGPSVQAAVDQINNIGKEVFGQHGLESPNYAYGTEGDKREFGISPGTRHGFKQPVLYKTNLNSEKTSPTDGTVQSLQSAIDNGTADYSATMADPRSAPYRAQLRPPKKKN